MKKILLIAFALFNINAFAYDLINHTYIFNITGETIEVYYDRCTAGINKDVICQKTNSLTIDAEQNGNNVGMIEIMPPPFNTLHIIKIASKTRTAQFTSVSMVLDLLKHGYYESDIMTCRIYDQRFSDHIFIENIDHQISCRTQMLFSL